MTTNNASICASLLDAASTAADILDTAKHPEAAAAMSATTRQSLTQLAAAATALANAAGRAADELSAEEVGLLRDLEDELSVFQNRLWHSIEHLRYARQKGTTPAVVDSLHATADLLSVNALLAPLDLSAHLPQPLASVAIPARRFRHV